MVVKNNTDEKENVLTLLRLIAQQHFLIVET